MNLHLNIEKPSEDEYGSYYQGYIDHVEDPSELLVRQMDDVHDILSTQINIGHRYAPEKWTLGQLMMHIIDTEIIFTYRALRISRGDHYDIKGFDQDEFINNNDFSHLSKEKILDLFIQHRRHIIQLFQSFSDAQWSRKGMASGYPLSVRAIPYILTGHCEHHIRIIKERYLS